MDAKSVTPTLAEVLVPIETREEVAKVAHVSHGTLDKVKVIEARATPEQKEQLVNGSKTINQIFVAVHNDEVKENISKKTDWPEGKYRVIYADPPWQYSNNISADKFNDIELHYPSMPLIDICQLPVSNLALDNSVLFLWVTAPFLEDSFKVVNAWGFKYKTCFVWDKLVKTYGHYSGVRHELVLVAVRGSCQPDISLQPDSVFSIKKTDHSAKPEEFRQTIDSLYPHGPRIELPEGWHSTERYGDIFVSPSGRAWGVKIIGTKFENVVVDVRAADFIGQSVIERRKEAVRKSVRRQSVQGQRTKPPILTAQRETSTAHEGIGGSL